MMFFPNKLLPARKRQEEPAPTPPQRRGEQKGAKGFYVTVLVICGYKNTTYSTNLVIIFLFFLHCK